MHLNSHPIDSRFVAYVDSNNTPPPNILQDLIEARYLPLQELQDLDRYIRVLDITMGALKRRFEAVRKALSVYEPILAPIRRLPEEMLEEIFYHCLPATRNTRPFLSESPLLLTLVCKKWKDIALASPRLWSTLHLPVPYDYLPPLERNNPFTDHQHVALSPDILNIRSSELHVIRNTELDKWLMRSGSLPLSISLFSSFTVRNPHSASWHSYDPMRIERDQEHALQTLHLIARYASRISDLEVVMPLETLHAFDEALAGMDLSQLRRVRVSSQWARGGRILQETQSFKLLSVKSIRKLSLDLHSNFMHLQSSSPWSANLTELLLHPFLQPTVALGILGLCPNLQTCSMRLFNRNSWGLDSTPDSIDMATEETTTLNCIELPALRKLSIQGLLPEITMICRELHAPYLTHIMLYPPARPLAGTTYGVQRIECEADIPYPPRGTSILCSFLSQCTRLDSLTINPAFLYGAEVQAIFSCLPQIETLVLDNNWTHRPSEKLTTTSLDTSTTLGNFHYSLHPLLKQERVLTDPSLNTSGGRIPLDTPLLPNLKFFSWNQFSQVISNELLVSFLRSRLIPMLGLPSLNTGHSTRSLTDINIKLITGSDIDIEAEIAQHAREVGLKLGVDFTLHISTYPWAKRSLEPSPQYVAQRASWMSMFSKVSADNLIFDYDATWPMTDI